MYISHVWCACTVCTACRYTRWPPVTCFPRNRCSSRTSPSRQEERRRSPRPGQSTRAAPATMLSLCRVLSKWILLHHHKWCHVVSCYIFYFYFWLVLYKNIRFGKVHNIRWTIMDNKGKYFWLLDCGRSLSGNLVPLLKEWKLSSVLKNQRLQNLQLL